MLNLIEDFYKDIGFEDNPNDPQLKTYNRMEVLSHACKLDYIDCVRNAVLQFENWRASPNPDHFNE